MNEVNRKGRLKIFLGLSSGVGKTYSMLKAVHEDQSRGVDVVVGCIDSYERAETNALLKGVEMIPTGKVEVDGVETEEMDLDAIIKRHPYLVVVDQLAHTNAEGSRHAKRYQDVYELLGNGINVYTTLNIQNLASKRDTVARITGVETTEVVPDELFDVADDVVLVDIASKTLLDRLAQGKIGDLSQMKDARRGFFKKEIIIALREITLRVVADWVDKQLQVYTQQQNIEDVWKSDLRLLVLITSSPSFEKMLRASKDLSYVTGATLVALYAGNGEAQNETVNAQLSKNFQLAHDLGVRIIMGTSNNPATAILNVARRENITHIVAEKPKKRDLLSGWFNKNNTVNRLLRESEHIDFYVVDPDRGRPSERNKISVLTQNIASSYKDYVHTLLGILVTLMVCLPISSIIGYQPIGFILLFVVLALSLFFKLGPVMLASLASAGAWYYFFVPPLYAIRQDRMEVVLDVATFFIIALFTAVLVSRVRRKERATRKREERTNALFHITDRLSLARNAQDVISIAKDEIHRNFEVNTYILLQDGSGTLMQNMDVTPNDFTDSEFTTALWTLKYSQKAGKYADTLPQGGEYTFYPLNGRHLKPGVIAIKGKKEFNAETELFFDTFLTQISNALEHHYYSFRTKKANLLFESDKLYRNLFNSLSHELRTPIAAVMGASELLLSGEYPSNIRKELHGEIFTAANRLNRLVENLLNISRIENRKIAPHIDWVDINDLFNQVVKHLEDDLKSFHVELVIPGTMPLVKLDFGLMEQALYNLVDNSCKYGQPGTTIRLKAFYDDGCLVIQEMNRGGGFSSEDLPVVFNKFYRGADRTTDGIGLGLSIVKGFVEAHNGTISAENRQNGGVRFTIKIPTEIQYII